MSWGGGWVINKHKNGRSLACSLLAPWMGLRLQAETGLGDQQARALWV